MFLSFFLMTAGLAFGAAACIFFVSYYVNKNDPEKERRALAIYHHVSRDTCCSPGDIDHILTDHYTGHFKKFVYCFATCLLCTCAAFYIIW
ncbi:hypothetical protein ALO45_200210 [Pseudomonas syringae pv. syringae]|nr:hypothetical protein ALO45_200210 [Pseudomonas syringae pv. syringae]